MLLILSGVTKNTVWVESSPNTLRACLVRLEGGSIIANGSLPYLPKAIYLKPLAKVNNELVFLGETYTINHQLSYQILPENTKGLSISIPNGLGYKVKLSVEYTSNVEYFLVDDNDYLII